MQWKLHLAGRNKMGAGGRNALVGEPVRQGIALRKKRLHPMLDVEKGDGDAEMTKQADCKGHLRRHQAESGNVICCEKANN
jgi:hypothetical protein